MSSITSQGYVIIFVGKDHHLADVRGYAYEHRLEAEKMLGRRLKKGEVVHHQNGQKADNRHENLEVFTSNGAHRVSHRRKQLNRRLPGDPNPLITCYCGCGEKFPQYDGLGRPRKYISGHNFRRSAR